MKRLLSLLLVLVMMLSIVPVNVFAEEEENPLNIFTDVEGTEYYDLAIVLLSLANVINGYDDGSFRPEETITRAEMSAVVSRVIEKEEAAAEAKGETDYDDVPADHWASGYINVATEEGIIGGDGDGKFRPEDPVLFEEAIKMIVCTFGYGEGIKSEGENWSQPYMDVADEKKITLDLKGKVGEEAKRGEIALMVLNAILSAPEDMFAEEEPDVVEEKPEVSNAPKAPVASPAAGKYSRTQYVELETETEGAAIYYTLDGTDPIENGTRYSGSIRIHENLALKAVALKDGVYSEVTTEKYEFTHKIIISSGSSKSTIASAELRTNGEVATEVKAGDVLEFVPTPYDSYGTITWTVGGVDIGVDGREYTVTALDMGKTIKAEIVGTDSYEGTASAVCTVATEIQVTAQDIMTNEVDNSPVALTDAENTVFLDDNGDPVTVDENSAVTLSIENTEKTPEEISDATTIVVQEFLNNAGEGVTAADLGDVSAVAVDVNLTVDQTAVHPVGDVTVTLSASQLGLPDGADLASYTFSASHTNKNGVDEIVEGVVVTIDDVQYVRFELNGLSTIWIGNIPPRTVSFYNTEDDADNKVNSIGSVEVKFGDLTPTAKIPTPSRSSYLFCGWNYDMTRTPIITNLEVHALWIEGEAMPMDSFTVDFSEQSDDLTVEINDGLVEIGCDGGVTLPANVMMEADITAPENAVKYYVGTDAAVVAAYNDEEGFIDIDENIVIFFEMDITDENGAIVPASVTYYYKWMDEAGDIISLDAITVRTAKGTDTATSMKYTADVDRGIGKIEAYLIDKDGIADKYVAYINNNLSGDAINGYVLENNISFDGYRNDYDFSAYDTLQLVFTPFEGEEFDANDVIEAKGEYYGNDTWNENWNGTYEIVDGNLVVTYPFDVNTMTDEYAYATMYVNDTQSRIYIRWDDGGYSSENIENLRYQTWNQVVSALGTLSSAKQYYINCDETSDIVLTNSLRIPANVDIDIKAASFTVASGATLTLVDDRDNSCSSRFDVRNGDFIVANGGIVTTAYVGTDNGSRYYPGIRALNVTFASGSKMIIPEDTLISIYPVHRGSSEAEKSVLSFESGSVVTNKGNVNINDFDTVDLNGTFSSTRYTYFHNDEINVNGEVSMTPNGYGYFELYGTVNIGEEGSVTVRNTNTSNRKYTNLEIYGPLTNKGTITLESNSNAEIMNNGFVNYNEGTISVASGCTVYTSGTKLVNTGSVIGEGVISASLGDDYTNYDDGTEYVNVENDEYWDEDLDKYVYNITEYSRYKYTHDPDSTVETILYLAQVINMADGICTVTVNAEEFPEA